MSKPFMRVVSINDKTEIIKYFLFIMITIGITSCKSTKNEITISTSKNYIFPIEWSGQYKGDLQIFKHNDSLSTIEMELIIGNPNTEGYYPWTIIYNKKDVRRYGLEAINPEKGHYRIDEFNSIKIDAFINNGHFVSRFNVMGNDLLVDYFKTDEGIEVNFYITSTEPMSTTGQEIIGNDTIPKVNAFPMLVFQKAILKKINK